jgi:hypothetical protein
MAHSSKRAREDHQADCDGTHAPPCKAADDEAERSRSESSPALVRAAFPVIGVCRRYLELFGGRIKNGLLSIIGSIG